MKMKFLVAASLATISAAIALPETAQAQQITSGIVGTVTDENGTPLANAEVIVTDTRTGATRTIKTGAAGSFTATNLVVGGPYTVSASASGFEGQTVSGINTSTAGNTSLSFKLSAGGGEIVVSATRVNVSQLAVGPGTSFNAQVIEDAPSFNRDIRDIIRTDPRVVLDTDSSSGQDRISCLGGNDRSNAFTVDGISQGDLYGLNGNGFASRSSTPIPFAAIRETSVEFAPFDVEYGQFTGCAINVITRSGGNDFHGSGFFEYTDNGLRGTKVADEVTAPVEPQKNWGVSLSGPIIKDRLFFFGAYSHQEAGNAFDAGPSGSGAPNEYAGTTVEEFERVSDILSSIYGIETGELVTNLPYENDRYFARLDWQINDQHRLETTYQHLDESTMRYGDFYESNTSLAVAGENNFYYSGTKSDYYSGRLYSDWTDNFSTEVRYAHSKIIDVADPVGGGEAQFDNPIPRIVVGTFGEDGGLGDVNGSIVAGPDFSRTANDLRTTVDTGTFIGKYSVGDHKIKFGAAFNRTHIFNLFVQNATGTLVFATIDDLEQGILSGGSSTLPYPSSGLNYGNAVGAYGNYSATGDVNSAAADFTRTIYSGFVQDDWAITDRLNATLGLRVDLYDGDSPTLNPEFVSRYGYENTTGFSDIDPAIMPRVAFTYDADDFAFFGNNKLRLGAGMFSGGDPLVWFGNAFQNNGITYSQGTLKSASCSGLTTPVDVVQNGQFTGVPSCIAEQGISDAARGLGDTQSIDPDIKTPSVLRINAGWETDLDFAQSGFFGGWSMKLDYIYSHFMNPFGLTDLSQVVDFRKGLNGYTVDGRPIYAAIDPTVTGCDAVFEGADPVPTFSNVSAACFSTGRDDELMLTNNGSYDSHTASIMFSKHSQGGLFTEGGAFDMSMGYAYTDGHDRRSMTSSTAGSNYDYSAAFDRQNPEVGRAIYSNTHNFTMRTQFTEEFFSDLKTRLGVTFTAHSGRPYSLTFTGGGVFGDSASGINNAVLYIPSGLDDANISPESDAATVAGLYDFTQSLDCAKKYAGKSIARNTCDGDWFFDMDLTLSQEVPGPAHLFGKNDKIRLYATMDNFLNFLDKDWNVLRQRVFSGLQDLGVRAGVDTEGRYILTGTVGDGANSLNSGQSVWRLKLGVSYNF